jgi:hypothetical protein
VVTTNSIANAHSAFLLQRNGSGKVNNGELIATIEVEPPPIEQPAPSHYLKRA